MPKVNNHKRVLNWRPSLKDHRDKKFKMHASVDESKLPKSADISKSMGPIRDQASLGSCVGESSNAAVECVERQDGQDPNFLGSPLFCYYNARTDKRSDDGAQIRDSIKALSKLGNCREVLWPYVAKKFDYQPTAECYKDGLSHVIKDYLSLDTLLEIKQALSLGHPVLVGFTCFSSIMSDETAKTGIVPMPTDDDSVVGGHAICLVGYDDDKKLLKFKNSWGQDWGDKGYGYLPYGYIPTLADDYWIVRK